jgi:hypothetical protein
MQDSHGLRQSGFGGTETGSSRYEQPYRSSRHLAQVLLSISHLLVRKGSESENLDRRYFEVRSEPNQKVVSDQETEVTCFIRREKGNLCVTVQGLIKESYD